METVTLSPDFQVPIPQSFREALNLEPGRRFQVIQYAGHLELIPLRSPQELRGFARGMNTTIERDEE